MVSKNRKKIKITHASFFTFCSLLFIFCFFSCQTTPRTSDILLDGRLPLEPGASVYVLAEKDALPLLKQMMLHNIDNNQLQQMIDRTGFAAAAVYAAHTHAPAPSCYRLAAWGNYPASRAKIGLESSKDWKKQRSSVSGGDYWHSPQNGVSLAITAGMALAAAVTPKEKPPYTPIDPFAAAPGTALPEGFAAFRAGSILSCWLTDPAAAMQQKMGDQLGIPLEIPARTLFISLVIGDDGHYTAHLRIQFENENQTRALNMMFVIARNFLPPRQFDEASPSTLLPSILFANPPELDGNNFNITTAPFSARELALLLRMFSIR